MTRKLISCCAYGVLVLALSAPIAEAGAKRKGAASTGQELPSTQVADLTVGECKRLGGFTEASRKCKSGTTCITVTRDFVEHSSCIDEVEQ